MAEKEYNLWEILKEGKAGERYTISSPMSIWDNQEANIVLFANKKRIHLVSDGSILPLHEDIVEAKFTIVRNHVPVWLAIKAFMDGHTISNYNSRGYIEATYSIENCNYDSIEIDEITENKWVIID